MRVYFAALADRALHGAWIEVTDVDTMHEELMAMFAGGEEWAIHDFDGFGPYCVSEHESLLRLVALAEGAKSHGGAFLAWAENAPTNIDNPERFSVAFRGEHDSLAVYVQEFWEGFWGGNTTPNQWRHPLNYVDWARMADALELSGDVWTADAPNGQVWVFNNCEGNMQTPTPLYREIASLLNAREHCRKRNNEWFDKHTKTLALLIKKYLPSGEGIDCGTTLDDSSTPEKLVFTFSYHHMNDAGYDGWTEHKLTVRPSLVHGIDLHISGCDRNGIKDHLYGVYQGALTQQVWHSDTYESLPKWAVFPRGMEAPLFGSGPEGRYWLPGNGRDDYRCSLQYEKQMITIRKEGTVYRAYKNGFPLHLSRETEAELRQLLAWIYVGWPYTAELEP